MILLEDSDFEKPLLVDVFQFTSETAHQFDLPYYYQGQIIGLSFTPTTPDKLTQLGKNNGYQHVWLENKTVLSDEKTSQITWLSNSKFYSLSTDLNPNEEVLFTRIGANDPKFNLRRDPAFILRKPASKSDIFISAIETHGSYNYVSEMAKNTYSNIKEIQKKNIDNKNYIAWTITSKEGNVHTFILCTTDNKKTASHKVTLDKKSIQWKGPYYYVKN